jgi:hypothetical protein
MMYPGVFLSLVLHHHPIMLNTLFTPETLLAAQSNMQTVLHEFPAGTTTTPVPGCTIVFNARHDTQLTVDVFVNPATATEMLLTNHYFTFRQVNGRMMSSRLAMYKEQLPVMGEAVHALASAALRVYMDEIFIFE